MDSAIIAAIISFCGSLIATFAGIITSTKLVNYKISELQKQVEKHNNLIDRTYDCEERLNIQAEKIKMLNQQISELKGRSRND